MLDQQISNFADSLDDRVRKIPLLEPMAEVSAGFLPKRVAAFFMDSRVAYNSELSNGGSEKDQNAVSGLCLPHAEFHELMLRGSHDIFSAFVRHVYSDFTGTPPFGLSNRFDDFVLIEQI